MLRTTVALGALLALFVSHVARAQEPPRRVAIVAGQRGAVAHRLAEELAAAGLTVDVVAAVAYGASSPVRLVLPEGEDGPIEIWEERHGSMVLAESIPPGEPLDTRVLRAAEIVRALAFPRRVADAPPPAAAATPTPPAITSTPPVSVDTPPAPALGIGRSPTPWVDPRPVAKEPVEAHDGPSFELGLAGALLVQGQGVAFSLEPTLRAWFVPRLGVGLFASVQLANDSDGLDEREGKATLRTTLVGLELSTAPVRTEAFTLVVAPGVAVANVQVDGTAASPYRGSTVSSPAAVFLARAEARVRVFESFYLTAGAMGGLGAPPIAIEFAGRPVSTWRGLGTLSLGVSLEP